MVERRRQLLCPRRHHRCAASPASPASPASAPSDRPMPAAAQQSSLFRHSEACGHFVQRVRLQPQHTLPLLIALRHLLPLLTPPTSSPPPPAGPWCAEVVGLSCAYPGAAATEGLSGFWQSGGRSLPRCPGHSWPWAGHVLHNNSALHDPSAGRQVCLLQPLKGLAVWLLLLLMMVLLLPCCPAAPGACSPECQRPAHRHPPRPLVHRAPLLPRHHT